jgi:cyclopropane fatty-acyl-phospholipid synthase-like methyltransferase
MVKYNKKHLAQLFDNMAEDWAVAGTQKLDSNKSIPLVVGEAAFEQLKLTGEDVLLDVGTGIGEKALRAAQICKQVIGIDISKGSLKQARMMAESRGLKNIILAYGTFEKPCSKLDLGLYNINKILAVYSLHHLPDPLKKDSIKTLAELLHRPGRIVIGDLMFFDYPYEHKEEFNKVHYDNGETDFPAQVIYLTECLNQIGAEIQIKPIHPLAGVIVADFL